MAKAKRDPFEIRLGKDEEAELVDRLSEEIQEALAARQQTVGEESDIDRWWVIYEGGSKNTAKSFPWPGAANLTSYLGTEKVDALRSRIMQTIFVEPVWIVEGWGEAAARASFVEEFHQWKLEEERLQAYIGKAMQNALVEGTGVLEVAERPNPRLITRTAYFLPAVTPQGDVIMDPATGEPAKQLDEQSNPIEVDATTPGAIPSVVSEVVNASAGPCYRVPSLKDFLILPGHASDVKDVWGYAKRFYRRMPELQARQKAGYYRNVDDLSPASERTVRAEDIRVGQTVALQREPREERAIWELTFLDDLENLGQECWYVATLSVDDRVLLRLQKLALGQPTYVLFTPLPRSYSVYGYSMVGNKMGTIIDEHTALRNQITDRSTMVNAAPILRVQGSLWDPQEQPWSPMAIIDVRDPQEVQAVRVPDVPGSMIQRESAILAAAERVSGLNDATLGVNPQQDRTLGEFNTVVSQSLGRIEEAVRNIQEPLEMLFTLRHELWKRALQAKSIKLPPSVVAYLEGRGVQVPNEQVDATMLEGTFRGKPRSSVEGADPNRLRNDFIGFLNSVANMAQAIPALQMQLNTPQAVQAILRQAMRVFAWKEPRALMGVQGPPQGFGQMPQVPDLLGGGAPPMQGVPPAPQ